MEKDGSLRLGHTRCDCCAHPAVTLDAEGRARCVDHLVDAELGKSAEFPKRLGNLKSAAPQLAEQIK